ncbi:hypothetical protein [Thalassospira sp.]|uniref:hypothetical protein n=1 Tax=Thalassospira sp. TaxID=1912094 RepID=UPI0032EACBCE
MTTPNLMRPVTALFCVFALVALGSCQTMDDFSQSLNDLNDGLGAYAKETPNSGPELAPASLPSFGVGDAFVFDSGRAIYVKSLNGDRVEWNGGGDYRFETTADFTGPNLDWSYTDQEDRKRTGSATVKEGSETIWPLSVAKFVRVSTKSENIDPDTGDTNSFDQWLTCKVPATETVEVPAGTFDSFVIECARYYKQWWMQTTRWWYAPDVGFYVKRYRKWNSDEEDEESLLTYGPAPAKIPQKQRERVSDTVQVALENINSGDTKRATQSSLTIAITPLKTVQTDKGVWCRTYRQELSARSRTSEQIKTACRTDDGWVIEDEVADKAS